MGPFLFSMVLFLMVGWLTCGLVYNVIRWRGWNVSWKVSHTPARTRPAAVLIAVTILFVSPSLNSWTTNMGQTQHLIFMILEGMVAGVTYTLMPIFLYQKSQQKKEKP